MRERYAVATRAPKPDRRFESRWSLVRGTRIHCRASRGAPPDMPIVVLVHGVAVSHRYLMPFAAELAHRYPVRVVDLPGFGLSGKSGPVYDVPDLADWLAAWLKADGGAPVVLIGNSVGTQIAVDLAVRHPDLVGSLVLTSPTMDPRARSMTRQILRWLRSLPHEDPSQLPILLGDLVTTGLPRALRTFRLALSDDVERKLPLVTVPTLVTRGELEGVAPQRWAEAVVELLPHGELAVVPRSPHDVTYTAPVELAALVTPFIDRTAGQRSR